MLKAWQLSCLIVERAYHLVIPFDPAVRDGETNLSKYRDIQQAARDARSATQLLQDSYVSVYFEITEVFLKWSLAGLANLSNLT